MSDPALMIQAVNQAVTTQGQMPVNNPQAAMDPEAITKFQDVMGTTNAPSIPFVHQITDVWRVSETNYQGLLHRIKALNQMRTEHGPTIAELMELQYDVAALSFQENIVTNVAKKASDAVQTLIKNG